MLSCVSFGCLSIRSAETLEHPVTAPVNGDPDATFRHNPLMFAINSTWVRTIHALLT
jgi:hypothetical protein